MFSGNVQNKFSKKSKTTTIYDFGVFDFFGIVVIKAKVEANKNFCLDRKTLLGEKTLEGLDRYLSG